MCTAVNQEDFVTVHHEMGHIEYFMRYRDQHWVFRNGANPGKFFFLIWWNKVKFWWKFSNVLGFHEAIGDTIALAVSTPAHLEGLGLLKPSKTTATPRFENLPRLPEGVTERDINYLLNQALDKVFNIFHWNWQKWMKFAFGSGGLFAVRLLDGQMALGCLRWHHRRQPELRLVETTWNFARSEGTGRTFWGWFRSWREISHSGQRGIHPVIETNDERSWLFIALFPHKCRYFVSFIVQFQFYESMCIAAGQYDPANPMDKPLYQCDFAGNKAAGLKML